MVITAEERRLYNPGDLTVRRIGNGGFAECFFYSDGNKEWAEKQAIDETDCKGISHEAIMLKKVIGIEEVVQLYDVYTPADGPPNVRRIMMECLPGKSMKAYIKAEDKTPVITAAPDIITGLEKIAARGVRHRDMKPANI